MLNPTLRFIGKAEVELSYVLVFRWPAGFAWQSPHCERAVPRFSPKGAPCSQNYCQVRRLAPFARVDAAAQEADLGLCRSNSRYIWALALNLRTLAIFFGAAPEDPPWLAVKRLHSAERPFEPPATAPKSHHAYRSPVKFNRLPFVKPIGKLGNNQYLESHYAYRILGLPHDEAIANETRRNDSRKS